LATSEPLLAVRDIHTYYRDSYILHGVSIDVADGQVVALLGRNSMGKTTLIRSIAGLTPPRQGQVTFKGQSLKGLAPYDIAKAGVGLVPQGRRIFPSLTVKENLLLPTSKLATRRSTGPNAHRHWDLSSVFNEFPRLEERVRQFGGSLSGGEQQMLAIARALMANPELILMDEPSEGLAPVIVQQISEIMKRIRDQGHSILLVEQNFRLAMDVADYVYIISSGCIVYQGAPAELKNKKNILDQHLGV
jgi:branched-chain amino acid transport system ATP-binding protein